MKTIKVFLLLLTLLSYALSLKAEEETPVKAYVIKSTYYDYYGGSGGGASLSFYYDNEYTTRSEQEGTLYELNEDGDFPAWINPEIIGNEDFEPSDEYPIHNIGFDPSFAEARPTSMRGWFCGLQDLHIWGLEYLNTSEVTDMSYLFYGSSYYDFDDDDFPPSPIGFNIFHFLNTRNVTDMSYMFCRCSFNHDYSEEEWETHVDENFCVSLDLYSCLTYSVTNMSHMFDGCNATKIFSSFDTSNVTDMSYMFSNCQELETIYFGERFKTNKVKDMTGMFLNCTWYKFKELNLANFDISNVVQMDNFLNGANFLRILHVSKSFSRLYQDTSTFGTNAFGGVGTDIPIICTVFFPDDFDFGSDTHEIGFTWKGGNFCKATDRPYIVKEYFGDSSYLTFYYNNKSCYYDFEHEYDPSSGSQGALYDYDWGINEEFPTWSNPDILTPQYDEVPSYYGIQGIIIDSSFIKFHPTSTRGWFCGIPNVFGLEYLNTSEVTDMSYMFCGCNVDGSELINFDTSKVTDMSYMFYGCYVTDFDFSHFNTSNVTNMSYMFYNCYNEGKLDLSSFNTSKVTNMSNMFAYNSFKELDVTSFDTQNVTDMNNMFTDSYLLSSLDLRNFDITNTNGNTKGFLSYCYNLKTLYIPSSFYLLSYGYDFEYEYNNNSCTYVGETDSPCKIYAPYDFDFGTDLSGDYFEWNGGIFCIGSDRLTVKPTMAFNGDKSNLFINLKNENGYQYNGYQFDLILPEGIELAKNNDGHYIYTLGNRYGKDNPNVTIGKTPNGNYRVVCLSLSNGIITDTNGAIIILGIKADDDTNADNYTAKIKNVMFSTIEGNENFLRNVSFNITVSPYHLGDANHNGIVNVADATMTINHILGDNITNYNTENADINGDGYINVNDVISLIDIIINTSYDETPNNVCRPSNDLKLIKNHQVYDLYLDGFEHFTACEMEVRLPIGTSLKNIQLGDGRLTDHKIMFKERKDGVYKVVVIPIDGKIFEDNGSPLLHFETTGALSHDMEIRNIQFTNTNFDEISFSNIQGATTSVANISNNKESSPKYNLQGIPVKDTDKGFIIQSGKKVYKR